MASATITGEEYQEYLRLKEDFEKEVEKEVEGNRSRTELSKTIILWLFGISMVMLVIKILFSCP